MELVQIRHFLTLAKTLNFTRAADVCNITQPALSRSIQRLEEELGGPLVLRERSLTQLSELGRVMLPLLQSTKDAAEAVRARAANHLRAEDSAPLRIGIEPSVPLTMLAPLLKEVVTRVAGVEVTLCRAPSSDVVEAALRGELDLVVLSEAPGLPERFHTWPLWQERVMVLAPAGHRLAALERVEAALLEGETLVEVDPPGPCGQVARRLLTEHGIGLRALHRGSEAEVALLVTFGLGLALAPASMTLPEGVVARPLVEPEFSHRILLGTIAGRPMNRAGSAFLKLSRARGWETGAVPI